MTLSLAVGLLSYLLCKSLDIVVILLIDCHFLQRSKPEKYKIMFAHSFLCNNRSGRCLLGNAWDVIHLIFVLSVSNPWPGNSWSLTFILLIFVKVNIPKVYPVSNISSDIITRWPKIYSFEEWQCCIIRKIKSVLCLAFVSENLMESIDEPKVTTFLHIYLLTRVCEN